MALLPHDDPFRGAFDLDIPSDFFITIPDAKLKCSSLDVPTMVACYLGIEDPLLVEHRTHVFKDRNTTRGNLFRSVDPYGRSLSLYMGPGHARAAILGGATRADSFADGGMAGAKNAWDASGGHVHGGAPPQL